jgi:hypothetical protein
MFRRGCLVADDDRLVDSGIELGRQLERDRVFRLLTEYEFVVWSNGRKGLAGLFCALMSEPDMPLSQVFKTQNMVLEVLFPDD